MGSYRISCSQCGSDVPRDVYHRVCPSCGGDIEFHYDYAHARLDRDLPGIWRFADLLPIDDPASIITLGEGNTPLLPARLAEQVGCNLHWKQENMNPTGAQKDRGLAVAITKAREFGFASAVIASTGSAGLSSAAYAARAGITHTVLVSRGTPPERIISMEILGSTIIEVDGDIEDTLELLATARDRYGAYETTTYRRANPYQSEGAKTLGYELFLQHGGVPDWIIVPVGGGGTLGAIWRAFQELQHMGLSDRMPKLAGVQPADYNALEIAEQNGRFTDQDLRDIKFDDPLPTILVKLQHTYPYDGAEALTAIHATGGRVTVATDAEALAAQRRIGAAEGIYIEPSSAVSLVAAETLVQSGVIQSTDTVVGILTGSGHRETHILAANQPPRIQHVTMANGLDILAETLGFQTATDDSSG